MNKVKVYCKECEYSRKEAYYSYDACSITYECGLYKTEDTYAVKNGKINYFNARKLNAKNNCKYFLPKKQKLWWFRDLWEIIRITTNDER